MQRAARIGADQEQVGGSDKAPLDGRHDRFRERAQRFRVGIVGRGAAAAVDRGGRARRATA